MSIEGDMSSTVTPDDKYRRQIQLVVIAACIIGCFMVVGGYVFTKGLTSGDKIVEMVVMGAVTLIIAGAGMAWSQIGLGRRVT